MAEQLEPRVTHNLDQIGAFGTQLANQLAAFRAELLAGGMPEDIADDITRAFARRILGGTWPDPAP